MTEIRPTRPAAIGLKCFDPRFADLPDYILKITEEIWEGRGLASLNHHYAPDPPMRFPSRLVRGNQAGEV